MNKFISLIKLKNIAIAFGIAIFFMADRGLKMFARHLGPDAFYRLIGDRFLFRFTPNPYISFSLPFSGVILNILLFAIIIGLIYYTLYLVFDRKNLKLKKSERKLLAIMFTIIIFGAISNLQDRLYYGYVIDYLEVRNFTVMNIADIMITTGAITLIYYNLAKRK